MAKINGSTEIKVQNRQQIYHFIRKNGPVSKQDIVIGLGFSLPTVTQNLQFLEAQSLIEVSDEKKSTGGRNATAYTYKKDGRMSVGIYMTGNHLHVACVDLSGSVIYQKRERIKLNLEDEHYLKRLGDVVEAARQSVGITDKQLVGVGISVPSLVSDDGEQVIYGLTHNFTGKTRAQIARYIPYHSRMFHDSYAAGFAEVWINPDIRNAVYINLNSSIGGSVIINNRIYEGENNRSGEIGHMTVVPEGGKTCYCGKTGCFETVCDSGVLDALTDGNLSEFFDLLQKQDSKAQQLWEQYLKDLSLAIHNIRMLFDCSIILGGDVGTYMDAHMEELYEKIDGRNCFGDPSANYVMPCTYKIEATAAGAAILLIDAFIKAI